MVLQKELTGFTQVKLTESKSLVSNIMDAGYISSHIRKIKKKGSLGAGNDSTSGLMSGLKCWMLPRFFSNSIAALAY